MSDNIEFYITLPSNDRSFPQSQQLPNNFQVRFPQPVNLATEYQVALYELFYNVGVSNTTTTDENGINISSGDGTPTDLFIYSDMIQSQTVGSTEVRLLKHINNNLVDTNQVFRATEPIQFVDVIAKHITQTRIEIYDQQGNPVPMNGTTVAVLAFRKKR